MRAMSLEEERTAWSDLPIAPEPKRASRRNTPAIVRTLILVALAGLALHKGHPPRAAFFGVLAGVSIVLGWGFPEADRAILRGLMRVSAWIGEGLGWLAAGVIEVLIVLPGRLITTLRRREPITNQRRSRSAATTTWRVTLPGEDRRFRAYAPDVPGRSSPRTMVKRVAAIVLVVLAFPAVMTRLMTDPSARIPPPAPVTVVRPQVESVPGHPTVSGDLLRTSPAMADARWRTGYADQFEGLTYDHRFYVVVQPRDQSGPLLTVRDHRRKTLEPSVADDADVPTIWLLGGSTVFGFAQRDDHTIASEIVRRSEAAGRPVRVVNLGVPGAVAFQDALVLERALAHLPAPDLVVAYEGANDVLVQDAYPNDQPTTFPASIDIGPVTSDDRTVTQHWADASLIAQLLPGHPGHQPKLQAGTRTRLPDRFEAPPADEAAEQALGVFQRSNDLARRTADRFGVPIVFALQPALLYDRVPLGPGFVAGIPDGTIDLTAALDGRDQVYLDDIQINEEGAALVASALFDEISDHPALGGR